MVVNRLPVNPLPSLKLRQCNLTQNAENVRVQVTPKEHFCEQTHHTGSTCGPLLISHIPEGKVLDILYYLIPSPSQNGYSGKRPLEII